MITLASWNPVHSNKSYHYQLADNSQLIIRGLDCLELMTKNNIKATQLASYLAVYCKIENTKNKIVNTQIGGYITNYICVPRLFVHIASLHHISAE